MAARYDRGTAVAEILALVGAELAMNPAMLGHAGRLAGSLFRAGRNLTAGRSAGTLLRDVQRTAARHPAAFVVGGLALGLVLARLAKVAARAAGPDQRVRIPSTHYTIVPSTRRPLRISGD
jgi:hypothetical protein